MGKPATEWNDWRWQLRNTVTSVGQARRLCPAPGASGDLEILERVAEIYPVRITPYYLSLVQAWNDDDPILRQVIPSGQELRVQPDELEDPIGDRASHLRGEAGPGLTHRQVDRVLLHATTACAVHCRHCFRRDRRQGGPIRRQEMEAALAYLSRAREVREVILTGGDPLILEDRDLESLIRRLLALETVRHLRVHTRMPVVNPFRITGELIRILRGSKRPVRVVTQFNHSRELTPESREAVRRLVDAGVPVLNQSVLLAGVNDQERTMERLLEGLIEARIQPYYLHLGDKARSTRHLRAPWARGVRILHALRSRLPGYALPRLMLEIPGGHGKVPVEPGHLRSGTDGPWQLEDLEGRLHAYRESAAYEDADFPDDLLYNK